MSRFTGFSETSLFLKKSEIWEKIMGPVKYYRFKFLEGIRLHWLYHTNFGEIRFLKWFDAINSNSWFLAILKGFNSLQARATSKRQFTAKFPEISGTHFTDLGRVKGWVDLGATRWFWTWNLRIRNPAPIPLPKK